MDGSFSTVPKHQPTRDTSYYYVSFLSSSTQPHHAHSSLDHHNIQAISPTNSICTAGSTIGRTAAQRPAKPLSPQARGAWKASRTAHPSPARTIHRPPAKTTHWQRHSSRHSPKNRCRTRTGPRSAVARRLEVDPISRRGEHQPALSGFGSIQYLWEAPPERVNGFHIQQTR